MAFEEECARVMAGMFSDVVVRKAESVLPLDDSWLSLKVRRISEAKGVGPRQPVFVSIPKKVVPLATSRNRLKRLIREAIRKDVFFQDKQRVYLIRVLRSIKGLRLNDVKVVLEKLK